MTKEEFRDHVTLHGCSIMPVDGVNHRGRSIKIVNDRFTSQYYYLTLPLDATEMADEHINKACDLLGIPSPF